VLTIEEAAPLAARTTAGFREEYPFAPRFHAQPGGLQHYVDEGPIDAPPVLCVHGNPTWSFLYRRVVRELSPTRRVVAPDHLGCGLSEKPQGWSYRLADHVDNLERLVLALDLRRITLVVHDWGGAIGAGFAVRHPERIERLFVMNTAAFPAARIPRRIAVCRTPGLGPLMVRGLNAFAHAAVHMAVERPGAMTPAVRKGLLAPYASWGERVAVQRFVEDIPMSPTHPSYATLQRIDRGLRRLRDRPVRLAWGMRDWCFTPAFLEMWERRFPLAETLRVEDAGHYLLEDAPERVIPWLAEWC